MKADGRMCQRCPTMLPDRRPGQPAGPRDCDRCAPRHPVRMRFERCFDEWRVTVAEIAGREIRRLTFASADKVLEMARRGGAFRQLEDRHAVEYALQSKQGLGTTTLHLTPSQYAKLKLKKLS